MNENSLTVSDLAPIKKRFIELGIDIKVIEREMSFALQSINKSKQLQSCTMQSKQEAILNIANTGLTLNPVMNLAYLVPRYNAGQMVCSLQPSYQGLVKVLTDAGSVSNIEAHVIYENDKFDYTLGTDVKVTHKPALGSRGEIIGVYAIAHLANGAIQVETMNAEDITKVMEMSESYKAMKAGKISTCVWVEHKAEMWRKTVIRRIAKYLPKTERYEQAARVIDLDQQDYIIDPFGWKAEKIERMCEPFSGNPWHDDVVRRIPTLTETEADAILERLERDAPNPVTHPTSGRGAVRASDINATVKEIATPR